MSELPKEDTTKMPEEPETEMTPKEESQPETEVQQESESEETVDAEAETTTEIIAEEDSEPKTQEKQETEHRPEDADPKPEKPKPKKRKKKTAKDYAIEFLIKIVITVAAVIVLCIFVVGIHVNHGNSSYPMIKDGDLVITYKLGKAQTGEEIAYKHDGKLKFGRIVARGGDVVEITESYLTVNGYGVLEDVVYPTTADGSVISFPYIVPEGAVFVLNDFRSDVGDSRTYGAIPLSDVEGEVVLILRRRGI